MEALAARQIPRSVAPVLARGVEAGRTVDGARTGRRPIWSDALTTPLAAALPVDRGAPESPRVKAIHTAAFAVIAASILAYARDGLRSRSGRGAKVAVGIAVAESIVFASNNGVCPLTPFAEQLGADRGSVTDIYLPRWISERVPLVGGATLVVAIALHAWSSRRPDPASG